MHDKRDSLGDIIKSAREKQQITIEALADRVGGSKRYIYRIENEGKKPSYDVLCRLIREKHISPDLIFYPGKPPKDSEIENLLRMLSVCDDNELALVMATVKALVEKQTQIAVW